MRQRVVFEITDRSFNHGVLAMLGLNDTKQVGAVRQEREQLPGRQQLTLAIIVITLPARIRRTRTVTEIDRPVDQLLDPEPLGKQRGKHHASVRDNPLVIQHDHSRFVHHQGDALKYANSMRER